MKHRDRGIARSFIAIYNRLTPEARALIEKAQAEAEYGSMNWGNSGQLEAQTKFCRVVEECIDRMLEHDKKLIADMLLQEERHLRSIRDDDDPAPGM